MPRRVAHVDTNSSRRVHVRERTLRKEVCPGGTARSGAVKEGMELVTGQRTGGQADLAPPAEFHSPGEDIVSPAFDFVQQSAVDPEHRLENRLAGRVEIIVKGFGARVILTRPGDF